MPRLAQVILAAASAAAIFLLGLLARPLLSQLKTGVLKHGDSDSQYAPHQTTRSDLYAALGQTRRIVFLGDSRVEDAEWAELFDRSDISNRGVSGDTTANVLRRLSASLPTNRVICFLQVGVNDLIRGDAVEAIVANYEKILRYIIEERRSRAIVTSIVLVSREQVSLNARINECNRKLADLAAVRGAGWVDLNSSLAPEGFLSPEYTHDGLHLNGRGYLRVRDALAPHLPK
jgi:lysophospholipase L1-like esterase